MASTDPSDDRQGVSAIIGDLGVKVPETPPEGLGATLSRVMATLPEHMRESLSDLYPELRGSQDGGDGSGSGEETEGSGAEAPAEDGRAAEEQPPGPTGPMGPPGPPGFDIFQLAEESRSNNDNLPQKPWGKAPAGEGRRSAPPRSQMSVPLAERRFYYQRFEKKSDAAKEPRHIPRRYRRNPPPTEERLQRAAERRREMARAEIKKASREVRATEAMLEQAEEHRSKVRQQRAFRALKEDRERQDRAAERLREERIGRLERALEVERRSAARHRAAGEMRSRRMRTSRASAFDHSEEVHHQSRILQKRREMVEDRRRSILEQKLHLAEMRRLRVVRERAGYGGGVDFEDRPRTSQSSATPYW